MCMFARRVRRWSNIVPTLGECLVFAVKSVKYLYSFQLPLLRYWYLFQLLYHIIIYILQIKLRNMELNYFISPEFEVNVNVW